MGRVSVPENIQHLLEERERARRDRDFARADALREELGGLGFELQDSASGTEAIPRPPPVEFSVHVLYEGYREDLERFLSAFEGTSGSHAYETVVVDNASADGEWLEKLAADHRETRVVHLAKHSGWAEARNAGLETSRGKIVVLADLSIEPTGDVLGPLGEALADPSVGVAGAFGLQTSDLHEFEPSPGPEVDAIEGYVFAARRDLLERAGLFHPKFKWYRHADIDLAFALRALGTRAFVVPLPVRKHLHRGWEELDEPERARLSKRNWHIFFDRWKDRPDLLTRRVVTSTPNGGSN
jgi:cysteinyl-tRNA synthetase